MIAYLDTSAFVPLVIREPSTVICSRVWMEAERCVAVRIGYVEVASSLAMARRMGRITARQHAGAWEEACTLWDQLEVVEVTLELAEQAAEIAQTHALRGYDAMHCAAAMQVESSELVAVTGDQSLSRAWSDLGVSVLSTS